MKTRTPVPRLNEYCGGWSCLETRARSAGFAATDLGRILQQAGDLYQPLAEEAGVQLTVSATPGVVVEADPKLLFEAVSNLVDNAIK